MIILPQWYLKPLLCWATKSDKMAYAYTHIKIQHIYIYIYDTIQVKTKANKIIVVLKPHYTFFEQICMILHFAIRHELLK